MITNDKWKKDFENAPRNGTILEVVCFPAPCPVFITWTTTEDAHERTEDGGYWKYLEYKLDDLSEFDPYEKKVVKYRIRDDLQLTNFAKWVSSEDGGYWMYLEDVLNDLNEFDPAQKEYIKYHSRDDLKLTNEESTANMSLLKLARHSAGKYVFTAQ